MQVCGGKGRATGDGELTGNKAKDMETCGRDWTVTTHEITPNDMHQVCALIVATRCAQGTITESLDRGMGLGILFSYPLFLQSPINHA